MPSPNKKPKKTPAQRKINADRSAKGSSTGVVTLGKRIAQVAPGSALWNSNAALKQTGQDAIAAAATVDADMTKVAQLEIQLDAARSQKAADEVVAGSKIDLFITNAEDVVTTPKEMQDLGLDPLTEHTYALANPISVTVTVDPDTRLISARVKRAPGLKRVSIEISSDLTMSTGVKVFPGDGARQSMGPFAPGTYAVRACHVRASERSGYTEIINVTVK